MLDSSTPGLRLLHIICTIDLISVANLADDVDIWVLSRLENVSGHRESAYFLVLSLLK